MRLTRPSELTWAPNPEGDYHAQVAHYQGHRIEVASDRDGTDWFYTIDEGECRMGHETREEAMLMALREIDGD